MKTVNKIFIAVVLFCLLTVSFCYSQTHYKVFVKDIHCAVKSNILNKPPNEKIEIIGNKPDSTVLRIWNAILSSTNVLNYSSFMSKITLVEASVKNCYSTYEGENFLLIYDKDFFYQFNGTDIDINSLIYFCLAHELGHFINYDVINNRSKQKEIDADKFACGILCNLNFKKEVVSNAMNTLAGANDEGFYPTKGERLKFILNFYRDNSCFDTSALITNTNQDNNLNDSLAEQYFFLAIKIKENHFENYDSIKIGITYLGIAISLKPNYEDAFYFKGLMETRIHRFSDAIEDFSQLIKLKPSDAKAYYERGDTKIQTLNYSSAIDDFNKAIALKPSLAEAYNYRGYAYFKSGNCKQAIIDYDKAFYIDKKGYFSQYSYREDAMKMCNK